MELLAMDAYLCQNVSANSSPLPATRHTGCEFKRVCAASVIAYTTDRAASVANLKRSDTSFGDNLKLSNQWRHYIAY